MIVSVTIWRNGERVLTGTSIDGELISDLKMLAESKGYRVEVKELKARDGQG